MRIKSIIALFAAVSFLTSCRTSELYKDESSTPNVGTITLVENIPSNETTVKVSETNTVSENPDTPTLLEHIEIEPQCAPSFGFSFDLPDDWNYEAVQTDD